MGHLRVIDSSPLDDANDLGQDPGRVAATHCVLAPLRLWNDIVVVLVNGLKKSTPMIGTVETAQSVRCLLHK